MIDGAPAADAGRARLEVIRKEVNREIQRLLLQLDTKRGVAELAADRAALATASRVREQVVRALEESAPVVVDALEEASAKAARDVAKDVDLRAFDADATATLEDIVSGRTRDVTDVLKSGAERIAEAVDLAVTTGANLDEAIRAVASDVNTTFLRAQAAVDSAAMAAGRAVTLRAGEVAESEGDEPIVYQYVGPDDGKTRPFCQGLVGHALTRDAIERLDNGTDLPADMYGGGYNCRHSWAPIELSEARALGITVDE